MTDSFRRSTDRDPGHRRRASDKTSPLQLLQWWLKFTIAAIFGVGVGLFVKACTERVL